MKQVAFGDALVPAYSIGLPFEVILICGEDWTGAINILLVLIDWYEGLY